MLIECPYRIGDRRAVVVDADGAVADLAQVMAGRGAGITMRPATVQRMVTAMGLQPPRVRSWLTRTDPDVARKLDASVKRYLAPPRTRRLRCSAETTAIHAWERRDPTWPRRPGQLARRAVASSRHGVVALCAAASVPAG